MGGAMQAQGHAQLLLNLLVFGMDLQPAIDAARFRHLNGNNVVIESAVPDGVRAGLAAMGHVVGEGERTQMGGSQAIMRLQRGYAAGSDPRKDGMAIGY
jgi:gamma-glutamyltranspeptidase/glutathione hydrolase